MKITFNKEGKNLEMVIPRNIVSRTINYFEQNTLRLLIPILSVISGVLFYYYYLNGLGLAYNDARSHLDIGRRVVEGLKPGLAQLGSVWLPLPHILMIPTIWNNFFWHSGLSGAIQSMISFVATSALIYMYLKEMKVSLFGRAIGVAIFVLNLNVLYLQSTAMTELPLIATMIAASYYFLLWVKTDKLLSLLKASFWVMLSTLIRYDGWFLLLFSLPVIYLYVRQNKDAKDVEGIAIIFATLGGLGIVLWIMWNLLIFKDPWYFIFGPFSAHEQQKQIFAAGELITKGNLPFSIYVYLFSVFYNSYTVVAVIGLLGAIKLWLTKALPYKVKIASLLLIAPLLFNILALYLGHSVLFVEGLFPHTWFNVRYGILLLPSIAIFTGYLVDKAGAFKWMYIGIIFLVILFSFTSQDLVTKDDALIGASGKNVSEVSSWLNEHASSEEGYILISAASHDAIIFSSGLSMSRFIHEGTGKYWENAIENPDKWARWIVLRTNDMSDWTFREIYDAPGFQKYTLVDHYPFADIYELNNEYQSDLITTPILDGQK